MRKLLIIFYSLLFIVPAIAQQANPVAINVNVSPAVFMFHAHKSPILFCVADNTIVKANNGKDIRIAFYAENDLKHIPMELVCKKGTLQILPASKDKKVKQQVVFSASLEELFSLNPSKTPYAWKWRGRAKAPVSPVANVAGEKVKQIKCWYILQQGKKVYSSDTVFIEVKQ